MATLPVMGVDPHLDSVTGAVVDANGGELAVLTVPNTETGWSDLVRLCRHHGVVTVGVEGASGFGRCLAQTLAGNDLEVREVPTRLTARSRRVDGSGKTDPGDARTIARAVSVKASIIYSSGMTSASTTRRMETRSRRRRPGSSSWLCQQYGPQCVCVVPRLSVRGGT